MKVGLVLSGGGARSFAQVGALLALEDYGVEISAIAANSSSAIVAALYASSMDARAVRDIVQGIDYKGFLDVEGMGGLLGHDGVERLLRSNGVPETFEELAVPLAFPTVDIERAEMLVHTSGPLIPLVCASNAFPGLFMPVEYEGRYLVDGGLLNNVPLDLIRPLTEAPVLVVDVRLSSTSKLDLEREPSLWSRITAPFTKGMPQTVEILLKAYTITQNRLIEILYATHPPQYLVKPPLGDDFKLHDWGRFDEGVRLGYEATAAVLESSHRVSSGPVS